jgi:WD domain, G-beta repeat.
MFYCFEGFAPDVKVWEVKFNKTGEFQQVSRAFELTGHSSGVYEVAFNADSSRMATVSKDGTWRAFNTKSMYTNFINHNYGIASWRICR